MRMSVNLYTDMYVPNDPDLPNWSDIQSLMPSSFMGRPDLLTFSQAHTTTYKKFKFAVYHLTILQQLYGVNRYNFDPQITAPYDWALAEAHSIIFNLFSTLDAISYEINLACNFQLKASEAGIQSKCIEHMIHYQNDALTSYLETSLYNQDWFKYFIQLRNRMAHRNLTIFQQPMVVGGTGNGLIIKIPDDPSTTADMPSYSKNIDLAQYCDDTQRKVLGVIEYVYPLIKPRIKQRYGI
jgi:hypothetical protein